LGDALYYTPFCATRHVRYTLGTTAFRRCNLIAPPRYNAAPTRTRFCATGLPTQPPLLTAAPRNVSYTLSTPPIAANARRNNALLAGDAGQQPRRALWTRRHNENAYGVTLTPERGRYSVLFAAYLVAASGASTSSSMTLESFSYLLAAYTRGGSFRIAFDAHLSPYSRTTVFRVGTAPVAAFALGLMAFTSLALAPSRPAAPLHQTAQAKTCV